MGMDSICTIKCETNRQSDRNCLARLPVGHFLRDFQPNCADGGDAVEGEWNNADHSMRALIRGANHRQVWQMALTLGRHADSHFHNVEQVKRSWVQRVWSFAPIDENAPIIVLVVMPKLQILLFLFSIS